MKGWDIGISSMKLGECAELTVGPEYAYGAKATPTIPANSTLIFQIELIKCNNRVSNEIVKALMENSEGLKAEGNKEFKAGRFTEALAKYEAAIEHLTV